MRKLSFQDHSRDAAGMTYVYPVLSRRSGGLSLGINLNPNNACNWRCVYCQVPNLIRGTAPRINVSQLSAELIDFLESTANGQRIEVDNTAAVSPGIRDIAISGNGEPTTCLELKEVIQAIAEVLHQRSLRDTVKMVMITNGSLADHSRVQCALKYWGELGGELWFKLDRATRSGLADVNGIALVPEKIRRNLRIAAGYCRTWIQTCVFTIDGAAPAVEETRAYLDFLRDCLEEQLPLAGVLVYGLARPSLQPEASRLGIVSEAWLAQFTEAIRALGLTVKVNP